jgi:hypothetical protein
VFERFRRQVLWTIEFDDEFRREADEVDDVRSDCILATEFDAEFVGLQKVPEAPFGRRGLVAKRAGEFALVMIAVYGAKIPPP